MKLKYVNQMIFLTFLMSLDMHELIELDCAFDKVYTDGYLKGCNEARKKERRHA